MDNYTPNSHKFKAEQTETVGEKKKIESVVNGAAKTRKKSELQKFTSIFLPEDISSVREYIVSDVLVPTIKNVISDIVSTFLYGESGRSRKNTSGSKVSYRSFYDGRSNERSSLRAGSRESFDYDNIVFESAGDAQLVLQSMDDILDQYRIVSVGDLYDLADVSTTNFQINNYGWTDLSSAKVIRTRDGEYTIKFPRPLPIK